MLFISESVVALIFQRGEFTSRDTAGTAFTLACYVLGLTGYFAQQVLTRAFYALQESDVPAKSAVVAVGANVCLNLVLVWSLGTGGLAASTAICSYLQVAILGFVLRRQLGPGILQGFGRALLQTLAVTFCMEAVLLVTMRALRDHSHALQVSAALLAGAGVFVLVSRLFRIEMLSLLLGERRSAVGKGRSRDGNRETNSDKA